MADAQLEADRLAARQLAQLAQEFHEFNRCRKSGVPRGRNTIHAHGHAPRLGDFRGNLGGGQHPAVARLGALGQFDLDHLDLVRRRLVAELFRIEPALSVATAEIAGADFIDQIAAALAVIAADPTLARVMGEVAHLGPGVQRQDGIGAQRAEAHGRNVVERGVIGLQAVRPADAHAKVMVFDMLGVDRMGQPGEARFVNVFLGPERALVLDTLGPLINQGADLARERFFVVVAFDQVLANFRADAFEQPAHMPDHRIVAHDRVAGLPHVPDPEQR